MTRLARRAFLLSALYLLASAATAYADCAWLLWTHEIIDNVDMGWTRVTAYPTYSGCRTRLYQGVGVPEPGSLRDWYDWLNKAGQYGEKRAPVPTAAHGDAMVTDNEGLVLLESPTGSVKRIETYFRCLPDTVDPRRPKVK